MSRMNIFCHGASLKRLPWPMPDGIVRRSMKLMTRFARRLPRAVRLGQQISELALRFGGVDAGGNPGAGCGGKSKLTGKSQHFLHRPARRVDERVFHCITMLALDEQGPSKRIFVGHDPQRLLRRAPPRIGHAISAERRIIDDTEQLGAVKPSRDPAPLFHGVGFDERWRIWHVRCEQQIWFLWHLALVRVAAQNPQRNRCWSWWHYETLSAFSP